VTPPKRNPLDLAGKQRLLQEIATAWDSAELRVLAKRAHGVLKAMKPGPENDALFDQVRNAIAEKLADLAEVEK
jgi:hypothetical protein